MLAELNSPEPEARSTPAWRRYLWWWLLPLLVFDIWLLARLWPRSPRPDTEHSTVQPDPVAAPLKTAVPQKPARLPFVFPTPQNRLLEEPDAEIFMPTASGRVESALYGTTRRHGRSGGYLPAFHEGIDIAPTQRDRRGVPLDPIFSALPGRAAYINRSAGNSNYGIYIVLLHEDSLGEYYTLYSHLASVHDNLRKGQAVVAGQEIGSMGHSSSTGIPLARAHLHFEIGVIQNRRFTDWQQAQGIQPNHGAMHGMNLTGVNPLAAFAARDVENTFAMKAFLETVTVAFALICHASRLPDYFVRYPALWKGAPFAAGAIVLSVSEGGVVLAGRNATDEEAAAPDNSGTHVSFANPQGLGLNGRRLIIKNNGEWTVSNNGKRWLDLLLH